MAKPRVILDPQKSGTVEVCCDEDCLELYSSGTISIDSGSSTGPSVGASTSGGSSATSTTSSSSGRSSSSDQGVPINPTVSAPDLRPIYKPGTGGVGTSYLMVAQRFEDVKNLAEKAYELGNWYEKNNVKSVWTLQGLKEPSIVFESTFSRIEMKDLRPLFNLAKVCECTVILRLVD